MSETITRTYELGYLLVPTAPEADVPTLVEALKGAIAKVSGSVIAEGAPEFIDLAYTMEKDIASKKHKYSQGYFGWIKFDAAPEATFDLKKSLDGMNDVIRYLLIKTSAQNMVVFKKPKNEAVRLSSIDEESPETLLDEGDDFKEDHELLPDVAGDIESPAAAPEPEEKEEV